MHSSCSFCQQPKIKQDDPKIDSRWSKTSSRWAKTRSRWARWAQDVLKMSSRWAKMTRPTVNTKKEQTTITLALHHAFSTLKEHKASPNMMWPIQEQNTCICKYIYIYIYTHRVLDVDGHFYVHCAMCLFFVAVLFLLCVIGRQTTQTKIKVYRWYVRCISA